MLHNFRTYQLAKTFYSDCQGLKLREPIKNQFERAVLSIVLNLAEGVGKPTSKDRRRFYAISMGSLREVQAILDLTGNTKIFQSSQPLAASLYRLMQNPGGSS